MIEYKDRLGFVPAATRDVLDLDPAPVVEEALALSSARLASGFMEKFAPGVPYRLLYRSVALSEQDEQDARYAADMRG